MDQPILFLREEPSGRVHLAIPPDRLTAAVATLCDRPALWPLVTQTTALHLGDLCVHCLAELYFERRALGKGA